MPVSADVAARRRLEKPLFSLGLTIADVAAATNLEMSTVKNDFTHLERELSEQRTGVNTKERRDTTYAQALYAFAQMSMGGEQPSFLYPEDEMQFKEALKYFLDYPRLRAIVEGITAMLNTLRNPSEPAVYVPYRRLLLAICGETKHPWGILWQALFVSYLEQITKDRFAPNRENFPASFTQFALATFGESFTVRMNDSIIRGVDQALRSLSRTEKRIVQMRFGFLGEPMTLENCGARFGLKRERARQIEAKALRKLRHPKHGIADILHATPNDMAAQRLEQKFPKPPVLVIKTLTEMEERMSRIAHLEIAEHFSVSVRTYRSLLNANIQTVRELLLLSEVKTLKIRNFGRKPLQEIQREILIPNGISLWCEACEQNHIGPRGFYPGCPRGEAPLAE